MDVILPTGEVVQTPDPAPVPLKTPDFVGTNPFYLLLSLTDGRAIIIDLDKPGWATEYGDHLRARAIWSLLHKGHRFPALDLLVEEGEQPYYTARHFATTKTSGEAIAYGIGKKRLDGHTDRLWVFEEGLLCMGDDVETFGRMILEHRR